MTVSALASGTIPHRNKYHSREGTAIVQVIPHHWAGLSGGDVSLADPNRDASANYIIYSDGTIKSQVPEEFRAWTTGDWGVDAKSITYEIQNSGGQKHGNDMHPDSWAVSDKAFDAVVRLTADIARRYRWGSVPAWRVRGHREFASTACPGGYLFSRLATIAARANALLAPQPTTPTFGQEEDDEMSAPVYVQDKATKGQGSIYRVLANGRKRLISKSEWNAIRAQEAAASAAGYPAPVIVGQATAADLKGIPDA